MGPKSPAAWEHPPGEGHLATVEGRRKRDAVGTSHELVKMCPEGQHTVTTGEQRIETAKWRNDREKGQNPAPEGEIYPGSRTHIRERS